MMEFNHSKITKNSKDSEFWIEELRIAYMISKRSQEEGKIGDFLKKDVEVFLKAYNRTMSNKVHRWSFQGFSHLFGQHQRDMAVHLINHILHTQYNNSDWYYSPDSIKRSLMNAYPNDFENFYNRY